MSECEILHALPLMFPPHWVLPRHTHDFHELLLITAGQIETRTDTDVLRGSAGTVVLYPREAAHAEQAVGSRPLRMLYVAFRGTTTSGEGRTFKPLRGEALLPQWIVDDFAAGRADLAIPTLELLLARLSQAATAPLPQHIEQVRTFIQQRLGEGLDLQTLADVAGCSPFHFAREFRAAVGLPPMRYVRQLRVETARTLLLTTSMPLRSIAPIVGLPDERELFRLIKRECGLTPGQLRQNPAVHRSAP